MHIGLLMTKSIAVPIVKINFDSYIKSKILVINEPAGFNS